MHKSDLGASPLVPRPHPAKGAMLRIGTSLLPDSAHCLTRIATSILRCGARGGGRGRRNGAKRATHDSPPGGSDKAPWRRRLAAVRASPAGERVTYVNDPTQGAARSRALPGGAKSLGWSLLV